MELKIKDVSLSKCNLISGTQIDSIDLKCNSDAALIKPFEFALIPTGIVMKIPIGYDVQVKCVKNFSVRKGLLILSSFDYQNRIEESELLIPIVNLSGKNQVIMRDEVIACLRIIPVESIRLVKS